MFPNEALRFCLCLGFYLLSVPQFSGTFFCLDAFGFGSITLRHLKREGLTSQLHFHDPSSVPLQSELRIAVSVVPGNLLKLSSKSRRLALKIPGQFGRVDGLPELLSTFGCFDGLIANLAHPDSHAGNATIRLLIFLDRAGQAIGVRVPLVRFLVVRQVVIAVHLYGFLMFAPRRNACGWRIPQTRKSPAWHPESP